MFFLNIGLRGLLMLGEGMGEGTFRDPGDGSGGGLCFTFSPTCEQDHMKVLNIVLSYSKRHKHVHLS